MLTPTHRQVARVTIRNMPVAAPAIQLTGSFPNSDSRLFIGAAGSSPKTRRKMAPPTTIDVSDGMNRAERKRLLATIYLAFSHTASTSGSGISTTSVQNVYSRLLETAAKKWELFSAR